MKAGLSKHIYISHSIGILITLMAITDIFQNKFLLLASAAISFAIFILSFPVENRAWFRESMFFILVILITSIINLLFTQNNLGGSLTLMGNLILAYLYLQYNGKNLTFWVVISYVLTIGFISFHLFVLGTHENFIYPGLSRNHAGFAVVFWTVFLLFHLKIYYNKVYLIPPFISLVLAFSLVGRTSLIVSALLLGMVFFYKYRANKILLFLSTFILVVCSYFLWLRYGAELFTDTNLDAGLDTPRWKLWAIYWEHIEFANIFTGIDVTTLPMYDLYSGNPHNSFIKFHSRVGIGFMVFLALFFLSVKQYMRLKHYYILILLLLLTLRASFDGDMLIGNFDFIFFILTFYWIKIYSYDPRNYDYYSNIQQ